MLLTAGCAGPAARYRGDGSVRETTEWDRIRLESLRLSMLWQLHPRTARRIHDRILSGEQLERLLDDLEALRISPRTRAVLTKVPSADEAWELSERLPQLGIEFRMASDPGYPAGLAEIPDPPPFLFRRGGCWDAGWPRPVIGIIGSRAASRSGREIARTLARDLALSGATIVSGLARGIDAEAHHGALAADGCTIGVLGAGLDVVYPPEHESLQSRMLAAGGIVSEFPPGTPPLPLHFPRRNRILAALVDVLVVVEGTEKSGARSTVDHALDQGREVLAVPRDPVIPGSALPNRLLYEGALPALSAREVIEAAGAGDALSAPRSLRESTRFGTRRPTRGGTDSTVIGADTAKICSAARADTNRSTDPGSPAETHPGDPNPSPPAPDAPADLKAQVRRCLDTGPRGLAELSASLSAPIAALQAALSELEVLGWVLRDQGRYRRR
ncbi:MAG: DNA-processing protein DprA [Candidatus Eisenbacteria bacterium]|uniref:DNA-processing protein DprA n=1 Tax=Eiseniibacteriota bacterium TaxID=2212470 RepID=A0A956LZU6_UNCEI|nr:DNA-processing protein DprA [Candidatus Eisenbacteria bacterium]